MISLFIDTSYKSLFLSLLNNDTVIDQIQIMSEFNFSETMIPKLDDLLRKNNLNSTDINRIYVTIGPGSFTGIRIGLTACKTLAYVLNIPIFPISSLEFMATTEVSTDYIIPFIDARHNMVFGAVYDKNGKAIFLDKYCSLEELTKNIHESYTFVTYDENIVESYVLPKYDVSKIVHNHMNDNPSNCHILKPNYLKKTEAEEKLNDTRI